MKEAARQSRIQHSVGMGALGRRLNVKRKLQIVTRHMDICRWYTVFGNVGFRRCNKEMRLLHVLKMRFERLKVSRTFTV